MKELDVAPPQPPPLLAMVTYNRLAYTQKAVTHLLKTMTGRAQLVIVDNGSTDGTATWLQEAIRKEDDKLKGNLLLLLRSNMGTAKAINAAWKLRNPGQLCAWMPNDVTIQDANWLSHAQEIFNRYPDIGTVNVKWAGNPYSLDNYNFALRSTLVGVVPCQQYSSHDIELAPNPFGAALAANPKLIERIGGFEQPYQYGWDDILYLVRSGIAGFRNVFLAGLGADHFDTGSPMVNTQAYIDFKAQQAKAGQAQIGGLIHAYANGLRSLHVPLV